MSERLLYRLAWVAVIVCVAPILAAGLAALAGDLETWRNVLSTVLPRYTRTTLILVVIVGCSTAVIGSVTAWLVTVYRFPGVRLLEIALALPLAFPAYVLAYAYTNILDHPGIVQSTLRDLMGWGPRDYWFPEIRSLGGAAAMLTIVLYPYVYLLARASFKQQSANAFLVARTLGRSPIRAFYRVALPMARPAIVGGALLAVMETIADFGTVAFFNVQTFATGIYQAWFSLGDRAAAAQLSLCLLSFALLIAGLERAQRGKARTAGRGARFETMEQPELKGLAGWGATLICLLPVLLGFVIPVIMLGLMALGSGQNLFQARYVSLMQNSVLVAGVAAVLTVTGAVLIGFAARVKPGRKTKAMVIGAGLGYAVPGGVIAVGLLMPMAALDNAIDHVMETYFGINTGLLITGSIWLMVVAYMARFMAAALNSYDSGMATVPLHYDAIGRSLGQSGPRLLQRIHLPVVRSSVLTAFLIVFVDTMKELPATLILHPFNFQTLAVQAHRLASDERLTEAAVPSLVLVGFGLIPVLILCRSIGREGRKAEPIPKEQAVQAD
ncbi:Putative 2-aminoethylphosphonate transport system permease protein PhnU [Roseovarius albus]|uniref:Putative 2-aminoethylphosphonate transport system permease protein PhnU n=1 Tax=Roseovarius albus TaxID=1247867 RepID=A0A1X6Y982_9RHOB|nr:iron ABC transporter permease [Roseovarius albus]SLN14348.1 Putative 2-aminoethylphosphonate transport system permease protein PhnU [Roseovarius albus]